MYSIITKNNEVFNLDELLKDGYTITENSFPLETTIIQKTSLAGAIAPFPSRAASTNLALSIPITLKSDTELLSYVFNNAKYLQSDEVNSKTPVALTEYSITWQPGSYKKVGTLTVSLELLEPFFTANHPVTLNNFPDRVTTFDVPSSLLGGSYIDTPYRLMLTFEEECEGVTIVLWDNTLDKSTGEVLIIESRKVNNNERAVLGTDYDVLVVDTLEGKVSYGISNTDVEEAANTDIRPNTAFFNLRASNDGRYSLRVIAEQSFDLVARLYKRTAI